MSNRSFFFPLSDKLAEALANQFYRKKLGLNKLSTVIFILGLFSPLFLIFYHYFDYALLRLFAPLFICFYVILDYSNHKLESLYHQRSYLSILIPFPPTILIFLWYEIVLCEVIYYSSSEIIFLRYYNVFAICCAISSVLIIFGYLKLNREPLNIHRFTEQLELLGRENEKEVPLNYITLSFKVLKQDLFACILLITSLFNLYLLYFLITITSIGFFGFTVYTLFLLKLLKKKK